MTTPTARFLLVTWAGGGNVNPLMALARRLLDRGHEVRALGPGELQGRFQGDGIPFRAHRSPEQWTGGPARSPQTADERRAACLRGMAADVIAEVRRQPTDVAVVDYMQPDALCAVEHAGVATAALVHTLYSTQAVGPSSPMTMISGVGPINALRAELGLAPVDAVPGLLDLAHLVIVTTVAEFDRPDSPLPPNLRFVGPLVEEPGPDAVWTPPPGEGRLIVASLGTTPMDEAPVVQLVLDALGGMDVRGFVTLGNHLDPTTLRPPAHVVVSRYVRHAAVLPHASTFVTHAGLSGIGAALTFGVPMVCVPLGREQPDNAAHVEAAGAGLVLDRAATVDELRSAITEAIDDDRYRSAARRLAAAIRDIDGGSQAVMELEALASKGGSDG